MTVPIQTASQYHFGTAYRRHSLGAHGLDWPNRPRTDKIYPKTLPLPLPSPARILDCHLIDLYSPAVEPADLTDPDLRQLSAVLRLGYGITLTRRLQGQTFSYRSVPSAGALYPAEIYLAAYGVRGLSPGLYHYQLTEPALIPIRKQELSAPRARVPGKRTGPSVCATFFITGIFFRSAWKYRDRAYRYVLLDAGHLVENLSIVLKTIPLVHHVSLEFDDSESALMLGLDPQREACLAMIHVHGKTRPVPRQSKDLKALSQTFFDASRVSERDISYQAISEFHQASCLEARLSKPYPPMVQKIGVEAKQWVQIEVPRSAGPRFGCIESISKRRSNRNYIPQPLDRDAFLHILNLAGRACTKGSAHETSVFEALTWGFLISAVSGFDPGFYAVNQRGSYGKVKGGNLSKPVASACLDQSWLASASAHFLFIASLDEIDRLWGPRGYRYAMIAAGRLAQILYLAASELELGCCGIGAFYDDEVRALLGLNHTSALLYLVALGSVKQVF